MALEPIFVRETSEQLWTVSGRANRCWFLMQRARGLKAGVKYARASFSDDGKSLLYEGWTSFVTEQGEPRWGGTTEVKGTETGRFTDFAPRFKDVSPSRLSSEFPGSANPPRPPMPSSEEIYGK